MCYRNLEPHSALLALHIASNVMGDLLTTPALPAVPQHQYQQKLETIYRKVHWDLQRATLRSAEEERHRVQVELGDRRQAVEKLRAKYETLAKGFAGAGVGIDSDVGGRGSSRAYVIIAAAQKREELQREGDELDQEIRRCSSPEQEGTGKRSAVEVAVELIFRLSKLAIQH